MTEQEAKFKRKLQAILIDASKKAEARITSPAASDIFHKFEQFTAAVKSDNMDAQKLFSSEIIADLIWFQIEYL